MHLKQGSPSPGGSRRALPRAVRFGVVGAVNTAIDFSVFAALFYFLHWPLLVANAAGFGLAVGNSYAMNKAWTFRDATPSTLGEGTRFFVVALAGLAIGSAVIAATSQIVPAFVAKVCAIAATFFWNYWASARFVFLRGAKA